MTLSHDTAYSDGLDLGKAWEGPNGDGSFGCLSRDHVDNIAWSTGDPVNFWAGFWEGHAQRWGR